MTGYCTNIPPWRCANRSSRTGWTVWLCQLAPGESAATVTHTLLSKIQPTHLSMEISSVRPPTRQTLPPLQTSCSVHVHECCLRTWHREYLRIIPWRRCWRGSFNSWVWLNHWMFWSISWCFPCPSSQHCILDQPFPWLLFQGFQMSVRYAFWGSSTSWCQSSEFTIIMGATRSSHCIIKLSDRRVL